MPIPKEKVYFIKEQNKCMHKLKKIMNECMCIRVCGVCIYMRACMLNLLECFPPGDLPDPGTKFKSLMSPALAGSFLTTSITWEACMHIYIYICVCIKVALSNGEEFFFSGKKKVFQ